jgi:hypothetical protein
MTRNFHPKTPQSHRHLCHYGFFNPTDSYLKSDHNMPLYRQPSRIINKIVACKYTMQIQCMFRMHTIKSMQQYIKKWMLNNLQINMQWLNLDTGFFIDHNMQKINIKHVIVIHFDGYKPVCCPWCLALASRPNFCGPGLWLRVLGLKGPGLEAWPCFSD